MKLITSRGIEYSVNFIDGPTITTGGVLVEMIDERRLPEIAAEFDGLEWMKRESQTQGNKMFDGYTRLVGVNRDEARGVVTMTMKKEA